MAAVRGGLLNTELWSELPKEQWLDCEYEQARETGLPLIIAEELDCAWNDVDVVTADVDAAKYGGNQFAGGSLSTPMNWMTMRQAGATARAMILAAAAQQLYLIAEAAGLGASDDSSVVTVLSPDDRTTT